MHCSKVAIQLQLYLDKQLTLAQLRTLEEHITICSHCQHELFLLEAMNMAFRSLSSVPEPPDLTANIMRRVNLYEHRVEEPRYVLFRLSLPELMAVVALATITTLGVIWQQPALRAALPFANGHDMISIIGNNVVHTLTNMNSGALLLVCWILGTILGIWITLVLLGSEMRKIWFKAMLDRLPVH